MSTFYLQSQKSFFLIALFLFSLTLFGGVTAFPEKAVAAACTVNSWTPTIDTVCSGTSYTQTSNCGTTRTNTGTKASSVWTPDSSTVCTGSSFTQTGNCGGTRTSTGTKASSVWTPDPSLTCSTATLTQTGNCGGTRTVSGTKCCVNSWTPTIDTVCSGTSYTQTSNCGTTRTNTGTKNCATLPTPPTLSFSASKTSVVSGGSSILTWSSTGATFCTASNYWNGPEPISGSDTRSGITVPQVFVLACTGPGGTVTKTVNVGVTAAAVNASCGTAAKTYAGTDTDYFGDPCSAGTGTLPALFPAIGGSKTWTCVGSGGGSPATCTAMRSAISCGGTVPPNATAYPGTNLTGLTVATNYSYADPDTSAKCEYSCNTVSGWNGSACIADPTITLTATPSTVVEGGSTTLTWSSTNTTGTCTASGDWNGNRSRNNATGAVINNIASNATYTLTCSNSAGETSVSTSVRVLYNGSCKLSAPNQCVHGSSAGLIRLPNEYHWICVGDRL